MKRTICTVLALASLAGGLWAGPRDSTSAALDAILQPLNADINTLVASIGSDLAPQLLNATLSGDIVGEASFMGDFPHGNITAPAIGISFGNGIATALNSSDKWQFVVPLPTLIQSALSTSDTGKQIYAATRQVFPYPAMAFGTGFAIAGGFEVLVNGLYLPQDAVNYALYLASLSSLNLTLNGTSVEGKLRKVFLRDVGPYPAVSLALCGAYGSLNLGTTLNYPKLTTINGLGDLGISGNALFSTSVYGLGLEAAISKRLPVITPFAKVGAWYRQSQVNSNFDLKATITPTIGSAVSTAITATPSAVDSGIFGRVGGGFELRFWSIVYHLSANFDLENPLVSVKSWTLTGIALNGLSVSTGFRWSF
jgi:hypothetical protein